jgi:TniQ
MPNMLPRERAEQVLAEYAAGKTVMEIARAYGHSPATIREYVHGRRTPGEPAAREDDFAPFAAYCRQRLTDDPHLRTPALLAELRNLGLDESRATFYRGIERHAIQPHPCPACHPARISGFVPQPSARQPRPSPLPVPAGPLAGETLASFLGRLATSNRATTADLLKILPPWFRIKIRWHDDRWQHDRLSPWADDAAERLARISGSTATAIKNALPAFGRLHAGQPVRAAYACRNCAAARGIMQPVPVHLPVSQQVCLKHGIWLPGPGSPQISVSSCPDILNAEYRARNILRRRTAEQLIYAITSTRPRQNAYEHPWKQTIAALIASNPRLVTESSPQTLFQAAAYPDLVAAASESLFGSP